MSKPVSLVRKERYERREVAETSRLAMHNLVIRLGVAIAAAALTIPSVLTAVERSASSADAEIAPGARGVRTIDGLRARAIASFAAGRYAVAAGDARRVLIVVPLDRPALRVLAMAEQARGNAELAGEVAIDASFASRRDPYTQLRLFALTSASGDLDDAARRGDTLARLEGFRNEGFDALNTVLARPGGITAVAARLATRPPWREAYLDQAARTGGAAPDRLFALLDRLGGTPARSAPQDANRVLSAMVAGGQGTAAWAYWRARHAGGGALIDDPDLVSFRVDAPDQPASPFMWSMPSDSPVRVTGSRDARGRRALVIEHTGERSPRFVSRWLGVTPGRYRLSYAAAGPADEIDRLRPDLACADGAKVNAEPTDGAASVQAFTVSVPPNCGLLRLSLTLEATESIDPAELSIRGVTFARSAER